MSGKILMIEDDFNFRTLMLPFFREGGYQLIHAISPAEARIELATGPFELIIVDGNLPEMDGVAFIKEMRDSGVKSKIMFLSAGWRDTESYAKLEELGVERILHKPILPAVLVEHVSTMLASAKRFLPSPGVSAKLAALSNNFAAQLPTMVKDIEDDLAAARKNGDFQKLEHAQIKAHTLRGTAGTYGFPQISAAMSTIDEVLKIMRREGIIEGTGAEWTEIERSMTSAKQWAAEFKDWGKDKTGQLNQKAAAQLPALAPMPEEPPTPRTKATLLFVTDDSDGVDLGELTAITTLDNAVSAARDNPYQVVLIKRTDKDHDKALQLVDKLRALPAYESVPTVIISNQPIPAADAVYRGVNRVVLGLPNAGALHTLVEQLRSEFSSLLHIVSFDDDPNFTRRLAIVLQQDGVQVNSYNDGSRVLEVVEQLNPDLLLLDVDMPGISGYDACRMLRKDARWRNLPIIFVTASTGWEARVAAFECGGDDYLAKPIVNAEIFAKSNLWLERTKTFKTSASRDSLTGTLTHSSFVSEVERHITAADTSKKAFAFGLIHLANLNEINEKFGSTSGDAMLHTLARLMRRHFRSTDIRGRWSGSKMAICLLGEREEVLSECLQRFQQDLQNTEIPVGNQTNVVADAQCTAFDLTDCASVYQAMARQAALAL